jgi:hypothetical protein
MKRLYNNGWRRKRSKPRPMRHSPSLKSKGSPAALDRNPGLSIRKGCHIWFKSLSFGQQLILLLSVLIGLGLRLGLDSHQIIWSYDQARDSFLTRQMIKTKDLILLGPQTEYYGLFHGPLYYYLIAPFYAFSQGETWLPILAMTLITFSSIIPLALLSIRLAKSKTAGILAIAIFSLAYPFIEYGRWLSNVSISLPFLAWTYFLFYKILATKESPKWLFFLLGLFLGLAVQGELFFLCLTAVVFMALISQRKKFLAIITCLGGVILGVLPLIIAELKFNFRGSQILINQVLKPGQKEALSAGKALISYFDHLGLTGYQTLGGISAPMGLLILALLVIFTSRAFTKRFPRRSQVFLTWFLSLFIAHALLFSFIYINAVFLDLGLVILIVILASVGGSFLLTDRRWLAVIIISAFFIFQINSYRAWLWGRRPFDHFGFIQEPSTFSHKEEIVAKIYEYAQGKPFTFASIGTPYGVRTVWASIFELYNRKTGAPIPQWYGYYANGYLGESILSPADSPAKIHVLIIESNITKLLAEPIINQEISNQNNHTRVASEINLHDTRIQFREHI